MIGKKFYHKDDEKKIYTIKENDEKTYKVTWTNGKTTYNKGTVRDAIKKRTWILVEDEIITSDF